MRALPFALACLLLLASCGDSTAQQAPRRVRSCGELEDVEPIEPVVIGEDVLGCPIFAPVPCTEPRAEYGAICGANCSPATATSADGDEWLLGCAGYPPFAGCGDLEYEPVTKCYVDPFAGNAFWYTFAGCNSPTFVSVICWSPCNENEEAPPDACP